MSYLPYGSHLITEQDIAAVTSALLSPQITQGPLVPQFESEVASLIECQYAVAFNSATSALHVACLALDLCPGDWLWTSPTTFVASANCALYCGANIDFVDIDIRSGLMDTALLEHKLKIAKSQNKLPKIIIPVHLSGTSCDMQKISSLSSEYGFSVIEDASHAIGASYRSQPVGSCLYSDICIFSFHPVKIITTAEGGLASTNSSILHRRMQELRSHGITKDTSKFINKNSPPWAYEQQYLGMNYRLSELHAALGISQLSRLSNIVDRRNELLVRYKQSLSDLPLTFLEIPTDCRSSVHLCIVRFDDELPATQLNFYNYFHQNNIGVQVHYTPVHLQPYYQSLGFKSGDFPNSERYAQSSMSLPLYPSISDSDFLRVVKLTREFFGK
jgi:UDP-4-amino-4,6-dideoxy-N-acetyl-beta-L-altrosamine transaminase